jgi:hypothetical protein
LETFIPNFIIKHATERDVPLILSFIKQLADYERPSGMVGTRLERTCHSIRVTGEALERLAE